jgi:hypothetical protein
MSQRKVLTRTYSNVWCRVKVFLVLFCALMSTAAFAQRKDETQGRMVVDEVLNNTYQIRGAYDGKRVELDCFPKHSDCVLPELGTYLWITLPAGKGDYMDCSHDGELYSMDKTGKPVKKIGQYCAIMGD